TRRSRAFATCRRSPRRGSGRPSPTGHRRTSSSRASGSPARGTSRVKATTRDHSGRPVPATVVLRAVDEKLFAIGGAQAAEPLAELYSDVSSGIVSTYRSHREPRYRGEGGDTTGGGGEGLG